MRTNLFTGCLLAGLCLAVPSLSPAQSRVTGRVIDSQGKPVAGAGVRAATLQTIKDAEGRYEVLLIEESPELEVGLEVPAGIEVKEVQERWVATAQPRAADQPVTWVTTLAQEVEEEPPAALQMTDASQDEKSNVKKGLKRDMKAFASAMKALDERGYESEAARLREIMAELEAAARPKTFDERAAALLEGDIQDRAVRVGILELCAEGYDKAGWESAAEAMHWFAAIGRAQVNGEPANMGPIPDGARGDGNVMDRMVELVLGAAGVHQQQGNPKAADACLALGRFYVMRELGAFSEERRTSMNEADPAPSEPAAEPEEEPVWDVAADEVFGGLRATDAVGGGGIAVRRVVPGNRLESGVPVPEALRGLGYVGVEVATEETHPRPDGPEARRALEAERRAALEAELQAVREELARVREQLAKRRAEIEAVQRENREPRRRR